jgi:Putative Ig domain
MFPHPSPKGQSATLTVCYTALAMFLLVATAASSAQNKILIETDPPTGAVGTVYQTTLSARGGTAPYIYAATGLPQGLTLNGTSGVISGTPVSYGTSSVNATVTDANANDAYLTFSIAISKSGAVSLTVSPGTANLLSNQTQQFTATVFNTTNKNVTWSCTAGTITSGGLYTAPTVNSGTWTYRVTATSVDDPSKSAGTIVEVSPNIPSLQITTTSLPAFMAGNQYSQAVDVAGGTSPYHWKVISGTLPEGISLNTTSGSVSGVSSQTGPFPVTVQVKDSSYPKQSIVSQPYTIVGSSILLVTTPLLPQITANQNYDTAVSVTGGVAPYKWSIAGGSLPAGISLNSSTGAVSGITTQTGGYNVGVQVTDSSSPQQKAFQNYFVESLPGQSTAADFYVATDGNDNWSGTLAAPNSTNTDGPFATIGRAQTGVQGILKNPKGRTRPIQVLVRAGTYYLTQPLTFTSADSGAATLQVNWGSYPDETPIISGGIRITNWSKNGDQWTATLPASTQYFEQLFYNGQRRLRPRLGGSLGAYYRVAATVYLPGSSSGPPPDPNCSVYMAGLGWECFDRFVYTATDPISSSWQNLNAPFPQGDIALYIFEKWDASKLPIKSIDTTSHIIYLTGPTDQQDFYHGFTPGHRYLIENLKDDFNQPGQWFLNRSKTPWTLSYIPNAGENPPTDNIIIPQTTQVLVASGLEYVTFQSITFEHDNWTVPTGGYASTTGDQAIPAAVGCYNCSNVTFNGVSVTQTSGGGLELYTTSSSATTAYNTIENSAFYDIGATGFRYGLLAQYSDTDSNVAQFGTIENNVVSGIGRNIPGSEAIFQGDGHDNLYTHNDIYDAYHGGIHICALACPPGAQNSHGAYNNVASFNHVYNLGQGILNDFGGIYFNTDPAATGNQVLNNRIHDVSDGSALDSDGYGGQGVYLDNNTANALVQNNLVYRISSATAAETCGPQTPGTPNNIVNNIFAYGRLGIKQEGCAPPMSGVLQFNFSNNLVYFDRGKVQNGYVVCTSNCPQVQMYANNMYCYVTGSQCSPPANIFYTTNSSGQYGSGQTFASFTAWQSGTGEDKDSVVQNPGFANPAYPDDDYTLQESPGVGFAVFDTTLPGRSNPVIPPPTVLATFPTSPFNPATDF